MAGGGGDGTELRETAVARLQAGHRAPETETEKDRKIWKRKGFINISLSREYFKCIQNMSYTSLLGDQLVCGFCVHSLCSNSVLMMQIQNHAAKSNREVHSEV